MAQADRLKAGAAMISANNLNKVIEQSNRVDAFQGGPGINSQSDATGLQMQNNRRRERPDGGTAYDSSSPLRRTLKRRTDTTRHKGEWELFNSSTVSQWAVSSSVIAPPRYGIPYLLTSSDGNGDLDWMRNDADAFGSSGPRSIERRVSSSVAFQQIHGFDKATTTLDTSETVQVAVRRRYGSSGNHYTAFVNSSDLLSGGTPRWDQVLDATDDVTMVPSTSGANSLSIGVGAPTSPASRWSTIGNSAVAEWFARAGEVSSTGGSISIIANTVGGLLPSVHVSAFEKLRLSSDEETILDAVSVILESIPRQTTTPVGAPTRSLWIDTANGNVIKAI